MRNIRKTNAMLAFLLLNPAVFAGDEANEETTIFRLAFLEKQVQELSQKVESLILINQKSLLPSEDSTKAVGVSDTVGASVRTMREGIAFPKLDEHLVTSINNAIQKEYDRETKKFIGYRQLVLPKTLYFIAGNTLYRQALNEDAYAIGEATEAPERNTINAISKKPTSTIFEHTSPLEGYGQHLFPYHDVYSFYDSSYRKEAILKSVSKSVSINLETRDVFALQENGYKGEQMGIFVTPSDIE